MSKDLEELSKDQDVSSLTEGVDTADTDDVVDAQKEDIPNAVLVSMEVANELMDYLKSRPMNEVESIVSKLANSRAVTVKENKEEESK